MGSDEYIEWNTFILSSKKNMQNKTKVFLVTVVVLGFGILSAVTVKAETTVPWCCVDTVGKNCNQITSADTCSEGLDIKTVACSTISTCPQYVAPASNPAPGTGIEIPTDTGLPSNSGLVKGILTNVANWLLGIIGIVAIIGFVIAGLQYFLVATDEKMLETAKKTAQASAMGIAVALSGYIVIAAIEKILNGTSLF